MRGSLSFDQQPIAEGGGISVQKSKKHDIHKLSGILKSINNISQCFEQRNIRNANDLKNDVISQAACTQFITNIHENKNKLQNETYTSLTLLNRIRVAGARHIASHDYDSVNFVVIYKICTQLTDEAVLAELKERIEEIEGEISNEHTH